MTLPSFLKWKLPPSIKASVMVTGRFLIRAKPFSFHLSAYIYSIRALRSCNRDISRLFSDSAPPSSSLDHAFPASRHDY